MKKIITLALISTLLLTSCTWGKKNEAPKNENPYPRAPISGEPTLEYTGSMSFSAKGTEPFWSVEVAPGESTLSRPSDTGTTTTKYTTTQDDKGSIIKILGVKGDFFLTLTKGECSDGMSDIKYAYNATLLAGAESLKGCANKK